MISILNKFYMLNFLADVVIVLVAAVICLVFFLSCCKDVKR